ncbi:MAG: hypothetical protein UX07_C0023G0013 [Parcubacteria group bacterium GW2011_GWA2_45_30]|nr:MAG: hypothetical protein UX07_C0023G0013 [Parcubacteria group bacterium GW2011_GWA2_45_30]
MNFLLKIRPEWPLRLGLGIMYLYSGYDLILNPTAWIWAVPGWFSKIVISFVPLEDYLRLQGVAELTMAFVLLIWLCDHNFVRIVAAISALEFTFILIFAPQFSITFRDIGLLGAAIALLVLVSLPKSNLVNRHSTSF